jgi:hypothetical protein
MISESQTKHDNSIVGVGSKPTQTLFEQGVLTP